MPNENDKASGIAQAILSELDHFQQYFKPSGGALTGAGQYHLLNEPCVAYAVTQKLGGPSVEIFICRNYVPFGYTPARDSIDYASYLSPLGRIIARKPGESHSFAVFESQTYELQAKDD